MTFSPTARRRQQQLVRWARRTPGFDLAVQHVLPRVRRSAVLDELAWRIFAPRHGLGNVEVPLLPDRQVSGPDVTRLPVLGVLATGLDRTQAEQLLADLADLQRRTASFRPVLLLDQAVFPAARRYGYVVEHVVPERDWAGGDFGEVPWADYVARRLLSVVEHYQLWHLVRVTTPDGGGPARLDPVDEALLHVVGERLNRPQGRAPVREEPPGS